MLRFGLGLWCIVCALAALAGDIPSQWRDTLGRAEELRQRHRFSEAEKVLVDAIAGARAANPADPALGVALNNLGAVYHAQGRYLEAENSYRRSLSALERALGPDHRYLARTVLPNFSELYLETNRDEKAERMLDRALATLRRGEPDAEALASVQDDLAAVYVHQGRLEEARPLLESALDLCLKSLGPEHPRTATALNNMAAWAFVSGRREEAAGYARRALAILEPQAAQHPGELAKVLANLGLFSTDAAEAEAYLKRALAAAEPALGDGHPALVPVLRAYSGVLSRANRKREAKAVWARAERIEARNSRENALGLTVEARSLVAR
ncbi:MAG: tetratricopeptide repeat protein [Acidobacteriota bacterium]